MRGSKNFIKHHLGSNYDLKYRPDKTMSRLWIGEWLKGSMAKYGGNNSNGREHGHEHEHEHCFHLVKRNACICHGVIYNECVCLKPTNHAALIKSQLLSTQIILAKLSRLKIDQLPKLQQRQFTLPIRSSAKNELLMWSNFKFLIIDFN